MSDDFVTEYQRATASPEFTGLSPIEKRKYMALAWDKAPDRASMPEIEQQKFLNKVQGEFPDVTPDTDPNRPEGGVGVGGTLGGPFAGVYQNLHPDFATRLGQMVKESQGRVQITDAYRTRQQQADLYARKPDLAAPPGRSKHEKGLAADLFGDLEWAQANASKYGLNFPMLTQKTGKKYEPWHVELGASPSALTPAQQSVAIGLSRDTLKAQQSQIAGSAATVAAAAKDIKGRSEEIGQLQSAAKSASDKITQSLAGLNQQSTRIQDMRKGMDPTNQDSVDAVNVAINAFNAARDAHNESVATFNESQAGLKPKLDSFNNDLTAFNQMVSGHNKSLASYQDLAKALNARVKSYNAAIPQAAGTQGAVAGGVIGKSSILDANEAVYAKNLLQPGKKPFDTYQQMITSSPAEWSGLLKGYSKVGMNTLTKLAQDYQSKQPTATYEARAAAAVGLTPEAARVQGVNPAYVAAHPPAPSLGQILTEPVSEEEVGRRGGAAKILAQLPRAVTEAIAGPGAYEHIPGGAPGYITKTVMGLTDPDQLLLVIGSGGAAGAVSRIAGRQLEKAIIAKTGDEILGQTVARWAAPAGMSAAFTAASVPEATRLFKEGDNWGGLAALALPFLPVAFHGATEAFPSVRFSRFNPKEALGATFEEVQPERGGVQQAPKTVFGKFAGIVPEKEPLPGETGIVEAGGEAPKVYRFVTQGGVREVPRSAIRDAYKIVGGKWVRLSDSPIVDVPGPVNAQGPVSPTPTTAAQPPAATEPAAGPTEPVKPQAPRTVETAQRGYLKAQADLAGIPDEQLPSPAELNETYNLRPGEAETLLTGRRAMSQKGAPSAGTKQGAVAVGEQPSGAGGVRLGESQGMGPAVEGPQVTGAREATETAKAQEARPAEVKEPWQMTKDEFKSSPTKKTEVAGVSATFNTRDGRYEWKSGKNYGYETSENVHRMNVVQALKEGKPVPPEVLADYPDLAQHAREEEPTFKQQAEYPGLTTPLGAEVLAGEPVPEPVVGESTVHNGHEAVISDVNKDGSVDVTYKEGPLIGATVTLTPEQRGRAVLKRRGPIQPRLMEPPPKSGGYVSPVIRGARKEALTGASLQPGSIWTDKQGARTEITGYEEGTVFYDKTGLGHKAGNRSGNDSVQDFTANHKFVSGPAKPEPTTTLVETTIPVGRPSEVTTRNVEVPTAPEDLRHGAVLHEIRRMYRGSGFSESVVIKNADTLMNAITRGEYSSILDPSNKVSRSIFEQITGIKLPKGLGATQEIFRGKSLLPGEERIIEQGQVNEPTVPTDEVRATRPAEPAGGAPANVRKATAIGETPAVGVQRTGAGEERHGPTRGERENVGRGVRDREQPVPGPAKRKGPAEVGRPSEPAAAVYGEQAIVPQGANYRITDADVATFAKTTQNEKLRNLDNALETLKKIESEGRLATPEEQAILVRFPGWGWTGNMLHPSKVGTYDYRVLTRHLTPDERIAAEKATQNSHYTSPDIIRAIYSGLARMGFNGGRVLEPSAGIGHFLGLMPEDMANASKWRAIEKDELTARILKQLYQVAGVDHAPYETVRIPNDYYDLVVSNVPFGAIRIHDSKFVSTGASPAILSRIHNYFFAKAIGQVRPGGLMAFITSEGTLNARDEPAIATRKYLQAHANFIGAIRLPNNAFRANAGTEVTTDILFFQKTGVGVRDFGQPFQNITEVPVKPLVDQYGAPIPGTETAHINEYFVDYPDMVLGEHSMAGKLHRAAADYTVKPIEGVNLGEAVKKAIENLPERIYDPMTREQRAAATKEADVKRVERRRTGSLHVDEGKVFVDEGDGTAKAQEVAPAEVPVIKDFIGVRNALTDVITAMKADQPEAEVKPLQVALKKAYNAYVKNHGAVHGTNRKSWLEDPDAYTVLSLEKWDTKTKKVSGLSDIFDKMVIQPAREPTKAGTPKEALTAALRKFGRLDLPHMAQLTGLDQDAITGSLANEGLLYQDPVNGWVSREEYLSGNVRAKLAEAKAADLEGNIKALEAVQPRDLKPGEIRAKIGSNWIPIEDYDDFLSHLLNQRGQRLVSYVAPTANWKVQAPWSRGTVEQRVTWGTDRKSLDALFEDMMNGRVTQVFDRVEGEKRVLNAAETELAQSKIEQIRAEWDKWIYDDPERAERLADKYNAEINVYAPRSYDGSHLTFPGQNPMAFPKGYRPHQKNAVWRTMQSPNVLYAHDVGSGKTAIIVASAMEMRRTSLRNKPMIVVKKSGLKQMASDFHRIYPGAKLLVADEDTIGGKRAEFMARAATGDWDSIIVTHDALKLLPVHPDTVRRYYNEVIAEMRRYLYSVDDEATVKEVNKAIDNMEAKLKKRLLKLDERQDNAIYWDDLGVDQLFVDEAHKYKKLPYQSDYPGMGDADGSDIAFDLFIKTGEMQKNGGGLAFSTGTPLTNSVAEMHTLFRFLASDLLNTHGQQQFDAWARNYVTAESNLEPDVTGRYKEKFRFAAFSNVPELMQQYLSVTDVVHIEDIPGLTVPRLTDADGNFTDKPIIHTVPNNSAQLAYFRTMVARAKEIKYPVPKGGDTMLSISTDGRHVSLDARLRVPGAPDYPDSKTNEVVKTVFDLWNDPQHKKDRRTQLVFLDLGVPGAGDRFNLYADMKAKWMKAGVPPSEIAFVQSANTEAKQEALFENVREGKVRILVGSREMMGVGVNVQDRLIAVHQVDPPWRPDQIEQSNGRMIRQGMIQALMEKGVQIHQYATKGSFDEFMWNKLAAKAKFIKQVTSGDVNAREIEDLTGDEKFSFSEMQAAASGNPKISELIKVTSDVKRLDNLQQNHQNKIYDMRREVSGLENVHIPDAERNIGRLNKAIAYRDEHTPETFEIKIAGQRFEGNEKDVYEDVYKTLHGIATGLTDYGRSVPAGTYRGFDLLVSKSIGKTFDTKANRQVDVVRNVALLRAPRGLGLDYETGAMDITSGIVTKLNNQLETMERDRTAYENKMARDKERIPKLQSEIAKPFPDAQKLIDQKAKRAQLEKEIGVNLKESDAGQGGWGSVPEVKPGFAILPKETPPSPGSGTLQSAIIPGMKEFAEQDVGPWIAKNGVSAVRLGKYLAHIIYPKAGAPRISVDEMMGMKGKQDQAEYIIRRIVERGDKVFQRMTEVEQIAFLDNMKTGRMQEPAGDATAQEMQVWNRILQQIETESGREIQRVKPTFQMLDNHFRIFWKVIPAERPLEGDKVTLKGGETGEAWKTAGWNARIKLDTFDQKAYDKLKGRARTTYLNQHTVTGVVQQIDEIAQKNLRAGGTQYTNLPNRPLQGDRGFLKRHTLPDVSEGIRRGGVPVTTDPGKLAIMGHESVMKYVTAQDMWNAAKDKGLRVFVRNGATAPEGFERTPDNIAVVYRPVEEQDTGRVHFVKTGEWYTETGTVRLIRNFVSKDLIRDTPGLQVLPVLKNLYTMWELIGPAFHGAFVTYDAQGSAIGSALRRIANLPGERAQGIRELGTALIPGAPAIMAARKGAAIRHTMKTQALRPYTVAGEHLSQREIDAADDFLKLNPGAEDLVRAYYKGGGRLTMHEDFQIGAIKNAQEAFRKQNPLGAIARVLWGLPELVSKPLFQDYIPNLKLGVFAQEYALRMKERAGDIAAGRTSEAEVVRSVVDLVDDRFGMMNFDNLFWNRTLKTSLQLLFRSITWRGGTARAIGMAGPEQFRNILAAMGIPQRLPASAVKRLGQSKLLEARETPPGSGRWEVILERERLRLEPRLAWLLGMSVTTALAGIILSKARSGKYPWEWEDGNDAGGLVKNTVFPHADAKDVESRTASQTYVRDIYHAIDDPVGYMFSGQSGIIGKAREVWQNRDFYGTQVYPTDADNQFERFKDFIVGGGKHMLPVPIAMQTYQRAREKGASSASAFVQSQVLPRAPRYVSDTPAGRIINNYFRANPHAARTPEEAELAGSKRSIVQRGRAGEDVSGEIAALYDSGKIGKDEQKRLQSLIQEDSRVASFKQLPVRVAVQAFKVANEKEKDLYRDEMAYKLNSYFLDNPNRLPVVEQWSRETGIDMQSRPRRSGGTSPVGSVLRNVLPRNLTGVGR